MTEPLVLPADMPAIIATEFIERLKYPLHFWRDDFLRWNGWHYATISDTEMDKVISDFLNKAVTENQKGELKPFRTTTKVVHEVKNAIKWYGHVLIAPEREAGTGPDGERIKLIPFQNGLLDIDTDELQPHTPDNLLFHVLPYDYDPAQHEEPVEFNKFMDSVWPEDDGSIQCTLEIIAYLISGATDLQKIFLFVGPARSGKGTLEHLIAAMVGKRNVCGVNVGEFNSDFGMQEMINKTIIFLPDQRNHSRGMTGTLTERLLTISGQDQVTINRKHKDLWTGVLEARIVILSNDIPQVPDSSGVVATRFVPVVMTESFLGREDPDLLKRLIPEVPLIIHKAIRALRRLRECGHFELTPTAEELLKKIRSASAPHLDFFSEMLIEDPDGQLVKMRAYDEYKTWCRDRNHQPCSYTIFCSRVKVQFPKIEDNRPRYDGARQHCWKGIRFEDIGKLGIENPHIKRPSIYDDIDVPRPHSIFGD